MEAQLYAFPTRRDHAAAEIRRALDHQAERLDGTDRELAELIRRLRDAAIRSTEARPC